MDCRKIDLCRSAAFTVVEISIVMVIIGLVIGCIVVGRDLIASATLRNQASQLQQIDLAIKAFRTKYDALPGDMRATTASAFGLGSAAGARAADHNGDGIIDAMDSQGMTYGFVATEHEWFFHHLSRANLINGRYAPTGYTQDGVFGGPAVYQAGWTYPAIKLHASYGMLPHSGLRLGGGTWIMLGAKDGASGSMFWLHNHVDRVLTPKQAYELDKKMDDGVPVAGQVRAIRFVTYWSNTPADEWPENDTDAAANCVETSQGLVYKAITDAANCYITVKVD